MRAGHQCRLFRARELRVQFVRRVVERAPAFLAGAAPQCRLRVQPRKIPQRDADLPHRLELPGHEAAKNLLQRRVDDGILKLRMVKAMRAAGFGKILEADCQRQFARLQLLAAQLAGQPRRLA